jgi:hypothetical protein
VEHRTLVVVFEQALMPFLLTMRSRMVSSIEGSLQKEDFLKTSLMPLTMRDCMVSRDSICTIFKGPQAFAGHGISDYIETGSLMYSGMPWPAPALGPMKTSLTLLTMRDRRSRGSHSNGHAMQAGI